MQIQNIAPPVMQVQNIAPIQDAPPAYHSTVEIERLLSIPVADRDPYETRAVMRHLRVQEKSETLPQV